MSEIRKDLITRYEGVAGAIKRLENYGSQQAMYFVRDLYDEKK